MLMKRYFRPLTLVALAILLLASCLNSDDDYTLYDDAALTAFSLTSAITYVVSTDSLGEDSVYTTTTTDVADYPFTIDQYSGLVYNEDSLDKLVDATKMLCSFSTQNSGIALIQSLERTDSADYLSTSDTIDFSEPRIVKVYSTSGNYTRTYTITVNVHKEIADSFQWSRMSDFSDVKSFVGMKAVYLKGDILLFGSDGNSTYLYTTSTSDGDSWEKQDVTFGPEAYDSAVANNDTVFIIDEASLLISEDGHSFEISASEIPVTKLFGGSTTGLYGFSADGEIMSTQDGGLTWETEELADDADLLPTQNLSGCWLDMESLSNTEDAILVGNRSIDTHYSDTIAHAWRKIVEHNVDSKSYSWEHIYTDAKTESQLPRLNGLTVVKAAGELVALGGAGLGACSNKAFKKIWVSHDHGASWQAGKYYTYPEDFVTSIAHFTAVADEDAHIWIICGTSGQVWKGRLNRMGWTTN